MGDKITLTVEERTLLGKAAKRLRTEGYVPAIMYGHEFVATPIMASAMALTKAYREAGRHHPVELTIGAEKRLAMIKDADFDPVKRQLRHVAFHVVKQDEAVTTEVPVVIVGAGETPAEKAGLVVLTAIDTVEIEALPTNLPDSLALPGEKLAQIGDRLTAADLLVPKDVSLMSDPDQVLVTVYEPGALQAANEAAGGDAQEPGADAEAGGQESEGSDEAPTHEPKPKP